MTKTIFYFLVSILLLPVGMMAQIYTGNEAEQKAANPPVELTQKGISTQTLKAKFTHFAYFAPSMTGINAYAYGPFKIDAKTKYGFMIENGSFKFFGDNFMLNDMGNIGLYRSLGLGVSFQDFNLPANFEGVKIPYMFADVKVGPDIRLEVADNVAFDLYANIGGYISYGGLVRATDETTVYLPKKPAFGLQTGFGLNVVFGRFVVGAQYTIAKGKYKYDITEDPAYYPGGPDETEIEYEASLNSLRLHIGVYINKYK